MRVSKVRIYNLLPALFCATYRVRSTGVFPKEYPLCSVLDPQPFHPYPTLSCVYDLGASVGLWLQNQGIASSFKVMPPPLGCE